MIVLILYQYSFAKYVPGLAPLSLSLSLSLGRKIARISFLRSLGEPVISTPKSVENWVLDVDIRPRWPDYDTRLGTVA